MTDLPAMVTAMTPGTYGIFALLAISGTALIKAWPILRAQSIEARGKLRQEERSDLHDCQQQILELRGEIKTVRENAHSLETKLVGAIAAYRILDVEVEAIAPGSTALAQARAVMSTAFTLSPSTPGAAVNDSTSIRDMP